MPRPVPMEDDPTRVGKVVAQSTPGDLVPVYSHSPVTITLRRFQFTGKLPPASTRNAGAGPPMGGTTATVVSVRAFRNVT